MPDPQDYVHDVFISYRCIDRIKEWMNNPRSFWDHVGVEAGNRFKTAILDALKTSKCLVAIWSKTYFQSPWCVAEWKTFVERAEKLHRDADGLTIPVQLHDSEKFAKEFKAFDFKMYNRTAPGWIDTEIYTEFEEKTDELAVRVNAVIQSVPTFQADWRVVDPDKIQLDEEAFEGWAFRLKNPA